MKCWSKILLAMMMCLVMLSAKAATPRDIDPLDNIPDASEVPSAMQKVFAGYYHFIEEATGDTL